jgi:hypothetical protein
VTNFGNHWWLGGQLRSKCQNNIDDPAPDATYLLHDFKD